MAINIREIAIETSVTGAVPRTFDERFSDVLNVKDFGAVGNNVADDTVAIQACLDAAFGSSGSPHGFTNRHQNRPVFFPNGRYRTDTLNLTRVCGGLIFGAGMDSTIITYIGSAPGTLFDINGMTNSCIRGINLFVGNASANTGVNLDWDGTGETGVGLNNVDFRHVGFGDSKWGLVIADSNNDGKAINVLGPAGHNQVADGATIDVRGDDATCLVTNPALIGASAVFKAHTGNLTVLGGSCECTGTIFDIGGSAVASIAGMRCESTNHTVFTISGTPNVHIIAINYTTPGTFLNYTGGGKVIVDACTLNSNGGAGDDPAFILGNGTGLYLRGNTHNSTVADPLDDFTGTPVQDI